jgi:hypothetical protein
MRDMGEKSVLTEVRHSETRDDPISTACSQILLYFIFSQASKTSQTTLEKATPPSYIIMSKSNARDYVDSYVKDIKDDTEDFLAQNRPSFDPKKAASLPAAPQRPLPSNDTTESNTPRNHSGLHTPTHDPKFSLSDEPREEKTTAPKESPQVVWAVRDFLDQKREIHATALDNCADLHSDLMTCFKDGSWWDKAKMCDKQKQRFWKCFHAQKGFLKDNNFKSPVSTEEEDAAVLRKADALAAKQKKEYDEEGKS